MSSYQIRSLRKFLDPTFDMNKVILGKNTYYKVEDLVRALVHKHKTSENADSLYVPQGAYKEWYSRKKISKISTKKTVIVKNNIYYKLKDIIEVFQKNYNAAMNDIDTLLI